LAFKLINETVMTNEIFGFNVIVLLFSLLPFYFSILHYIDSIGIRLMLLVSLFHVAEERELVNRNWRKFNDSYVDQLLELRNS
jgi:hypothetical protein